MNYILSLILLFGFSAANHNIPLQIELTNVRNDKGVITVSVFLDQASFELEKPFIHKTFPKMGHTDDGSFRCSLELPHGAYGIVILDDENENNLMDYNWMGIPKEGYGFSNFIHRGFSKPVYSDFEFKLHDQSTDMNITLRYF